MSLNNTKLKLPLNIKCRQKCGVSVISGGASTVLSYVTTSAFNSICDVKTEKLLMSSLVVSATKYQALGSEIALQLAKLSKDEVLALKLHGVLPSFMVDKYGVIVEKGKKRVYVQPLPEMKSIVKQVTSGTEEKEKKDETKKEEMKKDSSALISHVIAGAPLADIDICIGT